MAGMLRKMPSTREESVVTNDDYTVILEVGGILEDSPEDAVRNFIQDIENNGLRGLMFRVEDNSVSGTKPVLVDTEEWDVEEDYR
jgi:hypothetical protein